MVDFNPAPVPDDRRPALKGRLQFDIVNGQERVRKWPKKRGKPRSDAEAERREWFRQAMWATKFWPAQIQNQCREAVAGTPLLPRDIMVMIMAGRLNAPSFTDGTRLFPMAARKSVSESLDILSQAPGSMLGRGPEYWEPILPPPTSGYFLTWNPEKERFEWAVGSGGGGGGGGFSMWVEGGPTGSTSTSGYATKGQLVITNRETVFWGVQIRIGGGGQRYFLTLATFDPATELITGILSRSPIVETPTINPYFFALPEPFRIDPGTPLAILFTRLDGTAASPATLQFPSAGGYNVPGIDFYGSARYATLDPAVGDDVVHQTGNNSSVTMTYMYQLTA